MYPTSQERRQEEVSEAKKAISVLGGKLDRTVDFKLYRDGYGQNIGDDERKVKGTPKKYPRKAGTPTKEPIL